MTRVTKPDSREGPAPSEVAGGYRDDAAPARVTSGTLVISRPWRSPMSSFLFTVATVWGGLIAFWCWMFADPPVDGVVQFVFAAQIAFGLAVTYRSLANVVNRTAITVANGQIRVTNGPLPRPGAKSFRAADIRQLFVRRDERTTEGMWSGRTSTRITFAVDSGAVVDLVDNLATESEARFIEQTIEAHLMIEDDPAANQL